ncbi:MFS transporter [Lactobacillus kefiranofaciens]|uniref:MFS transporter n=1 Tax=Lactobacillus kefiranofaciens TaxID=267818 RepID=A0AAX3UG09_9LACO|nr:MFS transporter [Lactobacillus kefiranofaciens]AEG40001.1 possible transporter-membrane protein [Lactobacillus kefiranofaciens subsp. kefiranofaciens]MCP9331572.1 MFS transporter [Lactobacillus kefiranofaciens]MDF4141703.1 MFS transporter [Lactobacillus kefiranofaciens]PAK97957.1 MFS transporter [Lactobacillus kefiranofaciens]QFQ67598.1 MFS transporter [Lactobacillus kefiranofaciens subsp. kefiranofaciens]
MAKRKSIYTKDVILVMAASFFFMFSTMFVNPLINGYAKNLGASSTFAGIIVGIMSVAAMFLRPVAGNLTDKFSKYLLSFIGGVLILIGVLGYVFTPSSEWLLLFRLINGTGYVLCTVCMTTWLAFLVPRQHVGEAMGFYGLMNALAMALAPALSINIYQKIGYRESMIASAVSAFLMVIAIQFVGNHALPIKRPRTKKKHFKIIQLNVLPVAILTTLFAMPYFVTQADIVTYVEQKHLSVAVGAYFLIYAVVLLVIRIGLKRYFDTVRFGVWFWISLVSTAAYISLLAVMNNNWQMALAAAGMALGYGIIYSVLQSTALLLAPIEEQGLASSTFYLGLDIAMAFGPMISGVIDSVLPIKYFYWVELVLIPVMLLVYFIWRKRLNDAIDHH